MPWAWLCCCSSCTRRGADGVLVLCRFAENCTRSASLKSGLRTRNTHRGRRPPEDEPKGQGARRARPPLVGCICGLADSTSSASALRCCRCCRVARRGTVCPAPLPLGTACPIPCSSPHCTPVRVSCAPLPAKARVGPACSALPPPPSPFPFPVPSDAAVVARWLTLPLSSYPPSRHRSRSITEATSAGRLLAPPHTGGATGIGR